MMLAACWSSTPSAPPSRAFDPGRVGEESFDASTCPRDAIVETVCGVSGDRCGSRVDGLRALEVSRLHVTRAGDSDRTVLRQFAWDESATSSYRDKLVEDEELGIEHARRRCCYSKCTALIVGTSSVSHPVLALPTPEQCIPAPPAGTSAPAPSNRDCPVGVRLDGTIRAYVHANEGLCCYDMR
jgi:hypothetical protein